MTIPRFAFEEGTRLVAAVRPPADAGEWARSVAPGRRAALVERVLGGFPKLGPVEPKAERAEGRPATRLTFESEPGITLDAVVEDAPGPDAPRAVLLDLDGAEKAAGGAIAAEARKAGWGLVTLDLRATGRLAWASDAVAGAPDHNTAEWSLWIGRPLLGQWTLDVRRLIDALERAGLRGGGPLVVIGEGPAGLVALAVAATDPRVGRVAAVGALASYLTDVPYRGQRVGVLAPGMLRHVGDVAHLATLAAPRRVVIAGGVGGDGSALDPETLHRRHRAAADLWAMLGVPEAFRVLPDGRPGELVRALR